MKTLTEVSNRASYGIRFIRTCAPCARTCWSGDHDVTACLPDTV